MNTTYKKTIAILVSLMAMAAASAQNTYSGYFLDNYTYRSQMNPAFGSDRNYVGFPGPVSYTHLTLPTIYSV